MAFKSESRILGFKARCFGSGVVLVRASLVMGALFVAAIAIGTMDDRLINGVSVWLKPAKFSLSLAVHSLTLALGLMLLSADRLNSVAVKRFSLVFVTVAFFELFWIYLQASKAEASHFNFTGSFEHFMYQLMGIGAVTLTLITGIFGWKIFRANNSVMHLAIGWGFIVSAVLTTIVAGYLGAQTSHHVGGDHSDASGLALFGWSTTVGDLRVPHFVALHIAQAMPFLAWLFPSKRVVVLALVGFTTLVAALFFQAYMGIPLLRVE